METLTMTSLASRIPTETEAWKYLEKRRWKGHPVCPHCGVIDCHYLLMDEPVNIEVEFDEALDILLGVEETDEDE